MTQFSVFFGLKVCLKLFSSAEEVARVLQSKDLSAETVKSAVQMLQTHYTNLRSTEAFHSIFEDAQRTSMNDLVQAPALPPRRRAPRVHVDMERLSTQLSLFPAVLQAHNSSAAERPITQVTKVATIADMLAAQGRGTQSLFSEVDKLLRLYLTVPMSNATAERSFSSLRQLKTFLRSTMSECHLNHLLFLHIHKDLTDGLDLRKVLRSFCFASERREVYFGKI
ncbi:hypothetical protein OYC64_010060 [Pagothenia borchgrevinki]|uniref:HAT C-terminal dimerisation domain-containing protein n=1 Tax=Pagothenia borchgrevinki TaxID=8213 RepID=A0ABD2H893_PAGBO